MPGHTLTTDQLRLPLQSDVPTGAATFVRSPANAHAASVLDRWPDSAGQVMAICGPEGCGKSHLAAVWAERVGALALNGSEASHIDLLSLEGRPVLLDIAQDAGDETLFHLINLAQSDGGALLLVSRPSPRKWQVALPDLRSRLDAIRVVAIDEPDDTILAAILRTRFAERSITPAEDVIDYLIRRIDRSAAAAADVVARLDETHRPVTKPLARQVLDAGETSDLF
ncbi:chromosomal replication initiator DnaA [Brevundimonas sp.]|uniref:chromosomal replication initiator DnaA n=1 Tax=Brevundimonas sp. TaxID=1871086 RepID=UPI003BA89F91